MIRTLRGRLTLWYIGIVTMSLAVFAGLLYAWLSYSLYRHHDHELLDEGRRLARLIPARASPDTVDAVLRTHSAAPFVMLREASGALRYESPVARALGPGAGAREAFVHAAARSPATPEFFTARAEGTTPVRFVCMRLEGSPDTYLQVGYLLGDVESTLRIVSLGSLMLMPAVLLLSSYGGLVLAGRALRPIETIAQTLEAIQASDLAKRVDAEPADEELVRLVRTVNRLLDRLQRAFAALRQFAVDASHQLQTPLTVMKGSLEVALSAPRDAADYRRVLEDVAGEVDDMIAIVSDLRTLSLADAHLPMGEAPVDVSAVFSEAVELLEALGESRNVAVEAAIEPGLYVRGDRIRLKQVLLNLGDNAVKYTPAGGVVRIEAGREGADVVLTVCDTGPGVDRADLDRVFERFYRGASATERVPGTGLGLAIVKGIVEAHGGTVAAESRAGAGACFRVRLPLAR
jgi:signal transduction histidine kinase